MPAARAERASVTDWMATRASDADRLAALADASDRLTADFGASWFSVNIPPGPSGLSTRPPGETQ
jgi:acyl-homoserine-lactone acylase